MALRRFFRPFIERWRLTGNTVLIAGTDLVDRTVDADDIFTFIDGRLGERFIHTPADIPRRLAELDPELVIFGSGVRLRFPRPEWLLDLMARRIGVETMDTAAACRTYNILAGEGRNVIVALLLEQGL